MKRPFAFGLVESLFSLLFTGLMAFSAFGTKAETVAPGTFTIKAADVEDQVRDQADLQKMRETNRILRETEIPNVELRDATLHAALSF